MPSDIILALRQRIGEAAGLPSCEADVTDVERRLGFPLPALLRDYYLHIGTGLFGPGNGFMVPLTSTEKYQRSVVDYYLENRKEYPDDPNWKWPVGVLQICDWGCNNYSCVDCLTPPNPVLTFEPVDGPMVHSFIGTRDSLELWLLDWLAGVDLHDTLYEPAPELNRVGKNPKTGEPMVLKARKPKRR